MQYDTHLDLDFPTKQSAGYMFVQLFFVQFLFIIFYGILVFIGDSQPSIIAIPFVNISQFDIILILVGGVVNFGLFLLIFALWQSVEYRISPKYLMIERGLLSLHTESVIDFSHVDRFIIHETRLGKLFNYGTIEIFLLHTNRRPIRMKGIPFAHQFLILLNAELLLARRRQHRDDIAVL